MSRSQPQVQNPANRFFQWGGKRGELSYWDKERGEKGENVVVNLPFGFLVLDELATIGGFCKQDDSGYWSNEVRDTTKQPFTVRTKNGIKETGLYKELRDVTRKGAKYGKSVYIAFYDEHKKLVIGNVKFLGASLSAWIEFGKKHKTQEGCVFISGKSDQKTNGDTNYYEPVFQYKANVTEEAEKAAQVLDAELQAYLKAYFALQGQQVEEVKEDYFEQRDKELNDFQQNHANAPDDWTGSVGNNDYKSPVDDSDIPF